MALDIRGLGDREALSQIAKLAYGSGTFEGTFGGKGNIGLLDGHVVKFNTHWGERGGKASAAMRSDCNALRTKLSEIATSMLSASPDATPQSRARYERALADVRKLLEMDVAGRPGETARLLDRKVVAKVINTIDKATGFDAWRELRAGDAARALSSKGVDTTFGKVAHDFFNANGLPRALDAIAHPADGRAGVVLNEKAKAFLADLIARDLDRPDRRADADFAEIERNIRDFNSPYLTVTLQAFYLNSVKLVDSRHQIKVAEQSTVFLAGSPRSQRADRADVALSLFSDASPANRGPESCFAMALVSEKMPEMRRIQPNGRLTGETVWKACFGENAPEGLADEFGSRAFSDAFFGRLFQLGDDLFARYGGTRRIPDVTFSQNCARFFLKACAGMSFTAAIRLTAQDPTFTLDAAHDFVAATSLYHVEDARIKTEGEIRHQLHTDLIRNIPTVRLHDGQDEETFDFADARAKATRHAQDLPESQQQTETARKFGETVDAFVTAFDARYRGRMTEAARKVLLFGLTQVAFMPFAPLTDTTHTNMTMDIRREDDGAFVISYATDRGRTDELDVRYSYRIEPDGTNFRVGEFAYGVASTSPLLRDY